MSRSFGNAWTSQHQRRKAKIFNQIWTPELGTWKAPRVTRAASKRGRGPRRYSNIFAFLHPSCIWGAHTYTHARARRSRDGYSLLNRSIYLSYASFSLVLPIWVGLLAAYWNLLSRTIIKEIEKSIPVDCRASERSSFFGMRQVEGCFLQNDQEFSLSTVYREILHWTCEASEHGSLLRMHCRARFCHSWGWNTALPQGGEVWLL
jgi:hypothetical protein